MWLRSLTFAPTFAESFIQLSFITGAACISLHLTMKHLAFLNAFPVLNQAYLLLFGLLALLAVGITSMLFMGSRKDEVSN